MIKHIVTFQLQPMPFEQEEALLSAFRGLLGTVPEIRAFTMGRNISDRDQTFTHTLVADFDDMAAVGRYLVHPAHEAAIAQHLKPVMISRNIIDYEV